MLFGFTYKAFGRLSNTTIMWHTVAMIRLTSSLTIESNWMTSLWGSYAIQNQCFCLTKRTKHSRKQLYATWVTNNWGKLPFVIIVTHVTGKYRGAAHTNCNQYLRLGERISVLFRELKEYDAHYIMNAISKFKQKRSNK